MHSKWHHARHFWHCTHFSKPLITGYTFGIMWGSIVWFYGWCVFFFCFYTAPIWVSFQLLASLFIRPSGWFLSFLAIPRSWLTCFLPFHFLWRHDDFDYLLDWWNECHLTSPSANSCIWARTINNSNILWAVSYKLATVKVAQEETWVCSLLIIWNCQDYAN